MIVYQLRVFLIQNLMSDTKNNEQKFNPIVEYALVLEKFRDEFNRKWEISKPSEQIGLDNYQIKATLGSGSFGKVQLVKEKLGTNYFASKQLNKDQIVKTKQISHVLSEKRVLNSIRFPNTIYLVSSYKDNDSLYLILPYIPGGELYTYHRKMRKFSEKQARFYAAQIFLAFEYLHHCQVLYRDIKPENIMIHTNGYLKVTDFGFAKKVETRTLTLCGTPEYLAPEIIQSKPYGCSVDWWSFGILVFEFVAGHSPFSVFNRDIMVMYGKICDGDYKMPSYFSASLKDLIDHLLQVDLSKRYGNLISGNKDIKHHDWFREIDWISILNQDVNAPYVPTVSNMEDVSNFDKYPETKNRPKAKNNRHEDAFANF